MPFFLLFVLIPIAELLVFMNVSDKIGLGTALIMALFTAILGGSIVKYQGIQTMMNAQASLRQGGIPSKELFDGLCLVAAGALLITPGFITDSIGFSLLIPKLRDILREKLSKHTKFQATSFSQSEYYGAGSQQPPSDPNIIDVEFETIDTPKNKDGNISDES
tara:strand:+ start:134 stop:622 length:489 start_codon:yes stop_codon:yes gene_type:complete